MTSQGEVYGFVDKEGNIYLDETKISPEHSIHEYTHPWDRIVAQKNPKLWQKGVELMKQTSLWKEIDAKAAVKGSLANKFIGFADGIAGSFKYFSYLYYYNSSLKI